MLYKSILVFIFFNYTKCSRILAIVTTPSYSHQVAFNPIWRELSLRGHQVTLITTDPIKNSSLTNLTEIDLHFSYDLWNNKHNSSNIIDSVKNKIFEVHQKLLAVTIDLEEHQLLHPRVQDLIKNKSHHFDLVLSEYFHPTMYAFAELFQCPHIGISSTELLKMGYSSMNNPTHPALYPDIFLPFIPPLNLVERLISLAYDIYIKYFSEFYIYPEQTAMVKKMFGEEFSSVQELNKRTRLILVNSNPILHTVQPLLPTIIQIGGGNHIDTTEILSKELQLFLDESFEGVIYFSLGSNVQIQNLPKNIFMMILETFDELPYKVILKCNSNEFENKSNKMVFSQWLPQQSLLRHQNVKLFITQGGWQSVEEAIYSHTPIIGLPFYGDQPNNVRRMISKGVALGLDPYSITKKIFKNAILEIMKNPLYNEKMQRLAELAQDQPMTGLDKTIWWIEYVIRHKESNTFDVNTSIPFYQYYLLDIMCFITVILLIITYIFMYLCKRLFVK